MAQHVVLLVFGVVFIFRIPLSDLFSLVSYLSLGLVGRSGATPVINGEGRAHALCPGRQHPHPNTCLRAAVSMTTVEKSDCI